MEPKLIPLENVRIKLVMPSTGMPLSPRNTDRILERLPHIVPIKQQIAGAGQPMKHVTAAQAKEIEAEFRRTHWKKFKAAEGK